jgi:radical SAM superfamily enzyme YgiQ (UPF0313 family)
MKVLITAVNAKYIHSNLAVRYLKEYTSDIEFDCLVKEYSINDRIERITEDIISEKPDIVAFSCYIWNIEYVVRISNLIKVINPLIEILYGGPEVSFDSTEYIKNDYVDYVIEGEGEIAFKEFVEYKLGKRNIHMVQNLHFKDESGKIKSNVVGTLMNMDDLVFPYENESLNENRIVYYEASRGCPFNCKYCLSSTIHGVRFHSIERVKKELQFFMDKQVRLVKFVDRTFNCNSVFAKEIWKFVIESECNTTFHFEISADLLKDDEIELLKRAPKGRIQFEVGVQSTNPEVLDNINRFVPFDKIKAKVGQIKSLKNINQHLDLIIGLPGEDYNSFKNSFNEVYNAKPDELQLGFLKLLKGSPMRSESDKWKMAYSPYPPYEILRTNHISYDEIIKLKKVEEMVDKYYNSGKFSTIIQFFIKEFKTPFEFYYSLAQFFDSRGYFERNISSVDYYKVFIEFNDNIVKCNKFHLNEVIKYEYLRFNKKKWLPEFLEREWDKTIEAEFRSKLKENNHNISKLHIEKFKIDVLQFVSSSSMQNKDIYYVFEEGNSEVKEIDKYLIK